MASRPCFSVLDVHGPGKFGSPVLAPWSFQGSYPSRRTTNKHYQLFERLLKNFDFSQAVLYHPPIHLLCFFSHVLHGGSRPVAVVRFHESWPEEGIVHCVLSLAAEIRGWSMPVKAPVERERNRRGFVQWALIGSNDSISCFVVAS
jgi:hypothetical protein